MASKSPPPAENEPTNKKIKLEEGEGKIKIEEESAAKTFDSEPTEREPTKVKLEVGENEEKVDSGDLAESKPADVKIKLDDKENGEENEEKKENGEPTEKETPTNIKIESEVGENGVEEEKRENGEVEEKDVNGLLAKQMDYYFSDYNLFHDNYLNEQLKEHNGWVPVAEFLKFKRVQEIAKDSAKIVEAIKSSELLELSECSTKVRRLESKPLPDKDTYLKELTARTIHLKGFPMTSTFEELNQYCKQFGELDSLQMRRFIKTKQFKGCIHVVFEDSQVVKKILDIQPLKYKDRELLKEDMESYHKRKEESRKKWTEKRKGDAKKTPNDSADKVTVSDDAKNTC